MKSKKNIKSILIMAIAGIISFFFINMSLAAGTAKINVETANLREEANANSKILELLSLGEEVEVIEKDGDWYKVKAKGITGYLRQDLITVNEESSQENTASDANTASENVSDEEEASKEQEESTSNEQNVENSSNVEAPEAEKTTETSAEVVDNKEVAEEKNEVKLGKQKITVDTKLKIVPAINATDTVEVKKDEVVEATEIINGWVCVENENTKGWIRKEKIQKEEQINDEQLSQKEQENSEETENQNPEEQTDNKEPETVETASTVIKTLYVNSGTVNLRKEASTSSEIVTTLSVNTEVSVYEEANGWSKVKVDGKEGYISSSLLSETKQVTSRSSETPRTTTSVQENATTETAQTTSETENTEPASITTDTSNTTNSGNGSAVVATAKSYIGCKYVYGGTSPSGFDCSGFTQYIYKQYGVNLNRTAAAQYSNGTAVSRSDLQPGDLIMFGTSGINHVGIYMGGGMIVHAANSSRGVTTDTINSGYYNNNYVGARRVL